MPASQTRARRGGPLFTLLFWVGVALAPLAALLLLLGQGEGPLRIAAVLAVLAVVLIGLSITLRKGTETVRLELEETLLDEVDILREDVRQDIAAAARAQHRQFSEKLQALYESVETLRGQLEMAGYGRAEATAATSGQGRAGHAAGSTPVGHATPSHDARVGHASVGHSSVGQAHVGHASVGNAHVGHAPAGHARVVGGVPPAPPVVGGVVRHTETVQVTTRHTIVDPHGGDDQSGRGTVYGGTTNYGRGVESSPPPSRGGDWREPAEESWTEQRLRERLGGFESRGGSGRGSDPRESRGTDARDGRRPRPYDRDDGPAPDDRWSGMRAGDRWTSVRTDDRGREMHVGERRAAMHSDDTGTELRFEDRWASMRRDEPRRWAASSYGRPGPTDGAESYGRPGPTDGAESYGRPGPTDGAESYGRPGPTDGAESYGRPGPADGAEERWSEDRWGPEVDDTGHNRGAGQASGASEAERFGWLQGERRDGQPALPASTGEPSWAGSWEDQAGGRRRYRDEGDAYSWQADRDEPQPARVLGQSNRQRRLDFELSDDRWG